MVRFVSALGVFGALIASPAIAAPAEYSDEKVVKVWETDFSGRPPFKRVLKTVPAADVASLEAEVAQVETELKWVVDFRGKPPFKRKVVDVTIVEAASLEVVDPVDAEVENPLRKTTRFKRHR